MSQSTEQLLRAVFNAQKGSKNKGAFRIVPVETDGERLYVPSNIGNVLDSQTLKGAIDKGFIAVDSKLFVEGLNDLGYDIKKKEPEWDFILRGENIHQLHGGNFSISDISYGISIGDIDEEFKSREVYKAKLNTTSTYDIDLSIIESPQVKIVEYIDKGVFTETQIKNSLVESVMSNDSLEYVRMDEMTGNGIKFALDSNKKLVKVELLKLQQLTSDTFFGCNNLRVLNLPECTYIGSSVFEGCNSIYKLILPKLNNIQDDAFFSFNSENGSPVEPILNVWMPKEMDDGGNPPQAFQNINGSPFQVAIHYL